MKPNRAGLYPTTIGTCIGTYRKWFKNTLDSIKILQNNVDEIHIISDDFTKDEIEQVESFGTKYHHVPFESTPKYRNICAQFLKTGWVLHLDADELPTEELCKNLRNIVKQSYIGTKYQVVRFMSSLVLDEKEYEPCPDKLILHVNADEPYTGLHHAVFKEGMFKNGVTAAYTYKHFKTTEDVLFNSARDVFCGGGGDDTQNKSGLWNPLKEWTTRQNMHSWQDMKKYMLTGNADIWFKEWMDMAYEIKWHNHEYKTFALIYYTLHPEEDISKKYKGQIQAKVVRQDGHVRVDVS